MRLSWQSRASAQRPFGYCGDSAITAFLQTWQCCDPIRDARRSPLAERYSSTSEPKGCRSGKRRRQRMMRAWGNWHWRYWSGALPNYGVGRTRRRNREYDRAWQAQYLARTGWFDAPRKRLPWTAEEDRIVLSGLTLVERSILTGRTSCAVTARASLLRRRGAKPVVEMSFSAIPLPEERACSWCNGSMKGKKPTAQYCSRECANFARVKRPVTTCANPDCGSHFKPKATGGKWTRFCSIRCHRAVVSREAIGRKRRDCVVCGQPILPTANLNVRHCSRHCASQTRRKQWAQWRIDKSAREKSA